MQELVNVRYVMSVQVSLLCRRPEGGRLAGRIGALGTKRSARAKSYRPPVSQQPLRLSVCCWDDDGPRRGNHDQWLVENP